MNELIVNETKFCNEIGCEKNESGIFVYNSKNGNHAFNLALILMNYKEWLIEQKLVYIK